MPLSAPVERELLHLRDIELRGYHRADGLYDVEATLADTKTYTFNLDHRGTVTPGEKLHGMTMRMTVDEELNIVAFEASSDFTPYAICPAAAANFHRLAGLKIGPGMMKQVHARVGGTEGCTHLRELIQQMATVAYQSLQLRRRKRPAPPPGTRPAIIGTCLAYATDSPVVKARWPQYYTGDTAEAAD